MIRNGDLRACLRSRGFRRLLWTRLASQGADGFFQAGLAGSILFNPNQHADAIEIAVGFAVLVLPYSLISPYVGVLLDRWSRRNILFKANLLRAVVVAPTAALIWLGDDHLLFALFALIVIAVNRFVLAGLSASLPHVIEERRLVTGNAVSTTFGTVCFSLGLGAAALAQSQVTAGNHSYGVIALFAVLGYVAAAIIARVSFDRDELGPDEPPPHRGVVGEIADVARGMVSGAKHLAHRGGAAYPLLAQTAHRGLYGVLAIGTLLLYRNYFTTGDDFASSIGGLTQIVVAGAAGSLLAAVITPMATRRLGGRMWITVLLSAVAVVVLAGGLPYRHAPLVIAVFVINIASQGTKIVVDTAIQQECSDDHRGWVFSVNDTAFNLCFVGGLFAGALLLPESGHAPAVLIGVSLGYVILVLWFRWATARWVRRADHDIALAGRTDKIGAPTRP
ncbi:MAG: MFS transporter [Micromonosporaceae bacterium]|nr:MFS transporter [Micromonosporaceae bacterium]